MKLIAGAVLAGVVAGAAVLALPGRPGVLPAESGRKFATPVWHPEAEWKPLPEVFAGCHVFGFLDGPKREAMSPLGPIPSLGRCSGMRTAGRSDFTSYDPETERVHTMAGSAHGYLDGPFSRARFGGWDYTHRGAQHTVWSLDGRYGYFIDSWNGGALRGLDLEKQEAFTASAEPIPHLKGLAVDGSGRVLALRNNGELLFLKPGSREVEKKKLETPEGAYGGHSLTLALDPVHNRLYCSPSYKMSKKWYVWYWDLADGSFHGVLPMPGEGEPHRKGGMGASEAGPFKGTSLYPECYIRFGPDDPDYRFLYMSCTDQWAQYRLDLVKEEIHALSYNKEKEAFSFITSGLPAKGPGNSMPGAPPAADGDMFYSSGSTSTGHALYRAMRVK